MEDKTVITTAPPPPSEVKIRTMRSDIDSMMKSGGGAPSFQNVSVRGLSLEKNFKPVASVHTAMPTAAPAQARQATPSGTFPGTPTTQIFSTPIPAAASMPDPAETDQAGGASGSNLMPILIVVLVAVIAIAVVGYFAYTIFK